MQNGSRLKYPAIRAGCQSFDEINRLFGNVGIPDQKKLAEPDVGPEYSERENKFSEVMKVVWIYNLQIASVFQEDTNQSNHG